MTARHPVVLATTNYKSGLVAEVWLLDASLQDVSLLGSATLTGAGDANAATIPVTPALQEGDVIGIRFSASASTQSTVEVVFGRSPDPYDDAVLDSCRTGD